MKINRPLWGLRMKYNNEKLYTSVAWIFHCIWKKIWLLSSLSTSSDKNERREKRKINNPHFNTVRQHHSKPQQATSYRKSPRIMTIMMLYHKQWFLKELLMRNVLNLFSFSLRLHFSFLFKRIKLRRLTTMEIKTLKAL